MKRPEKLNKKRQVNIYLNDSLNKRLKEIQLVTGCSVSEIFRQALLRYKP